MSMELLCSWVRDGETLTLNVRELLAHAIIVDLAPPAL